MFDGLRTRIKEFIGTIAPQEEPNLPTRPTADQAPTFESILRQYHAIELKDSKTPLPDGYHHRARLNDKLYAFREPKDWLLASDEIVTKLRIPVRFDAQLTSEIPT